MMGQSGKPVLLGLGETRDREKTGLIPRRPGTCNPKEREDREAAT